jgi:DNA mismatch repair protein MLH3
VANALTTNPPNLDACLKQRKLGSMPSRILPLSEDAISQITSSKQITSLSGVILALLENALDADATKIDVAVNFGRGSCVVEDNGCGIPSTEFSEDGGLGKLHHTSKTTSGQTTHGSSGTYLASLAALSMLSIVSRHLSEDVSATMIMHQGRVVARHLPSPPTNELTAFGTHGTQVSVNDLFGNMPVRVKQRALHDVRGTSTDDRTWLDLKRSISALLLAWKAPCSVKLRDSESHNKNLTISGSHSTVSSALTERNLNTLQGKAVRYDLRDAFPLLFQAGLAPFVSRSQWVPVSASTSRLSCHGLICLDPSPTRLCQFVSIGIEPCSSISGHSLIYETINKLFSNSSFGTVTEQDIAGKDRRGLRSSDNDATTQQKTSKGIDRWPMFVLQLKFKGETEMPARDQRENQLKQILDVLEAMIRQWLDVNDHRPQQKRTRKIQYPVADGNTTSSPLQIARRDLHPRFGNESSPYHKTSVSGRLSTATEGRAANVFGDEAHMYNSPSKRLRTSGDIGHLSRIKSGKKDVAASPGLPRSPVAVGSTHFTLPPLEPGSLSRHFKATKPSRDALSTSVVNAASKIADLPTMTPSDDYGSISETDLLNAAASADDTIQTHPVKHSDATADKISDHDDIVEWRDPVTKQTFKVNSRTGIVVPSDRPDTSLNALMNTGPRRPASAATATTAAGRPLTLTGRVASAGERTSDHSVPTFLRDWQNPVFACQAEQIIPIASVRGPGMDTSDSGDHCCSHKDVSNYFAASTAGAPSKLSKTDLQHARVINQIDAKFVLCSLTSIGSGTQTLVLVDQHAASERVILESLLSDLCSPIDKLSPAASLRTNLDCASAVSTVLLDQQLLFEVTREEHDLFRSHAPLFARFGILYDLRATTEGKVRHTLATRALPPAIAERCKLFPKLLIDLLRSEIWSRVDSGTSLAAGQPDVLREEQGWLERIGSCPKALLDIVNSRACRSAVMFNDVLSIRECEELMAKLARCAFPFMCAHGRVSMVPIGTVGGDGETIFDEQCGRPVLDKVDAEERAFSRAFRDWRPGT